MSAFENLNQGWGGAYVAPATTTSPIGPEPAPIVRTMTRKFGQVLLFGTLAISGVYTSPWFDTNQTGGVFVAVYISCVSKNMNAVSNGLVIQGSNDPNVSQSIVTLVGSTSNAIANTATPWTSVVSFRYWRVIVSNDASTVASGLEISACELSTPGVIQVTQPILGAFQAAVTSGSASINGYADGGSILGNWYNGSGSTNVPVVAVGLATSVATSGGTLTQLSAMRTPNVFKVLASVAVTAGTPVSVWTPAAGKKFRIMGWSLSLSVAGKILIQDATGTTVLQTPLQAAGVGLASPNIGNGYLSALANNHVFVDVSANGNVDGIIYGTEE